MATERACDGPHNISVLLYLGLDIDEDGKKLRPIMRCRGSSDTLPISRAPPLPHRHNTSICGEADMFGGNGMVTDISVEPPGCKEWEIDANWFSMG